MTVTASASDDDAPRARRIVFCPPVSKHRWNGNTARFGKGGGISGSHTQVLYLAEGLAKLRSGRQVGESGAALWDVTIAGGVLEPRNGERINGVRYVADLDDEAIQGKRAGTPSRKGGEALSPSVVVVPEIFDVVVSDFGLTNYERVRARHVVFIMGCQTLNNQWTQRMYLEQQRVAHAVTTPGGGGDGVGSCSGFAVTFVHRAPWSYRVFTRESGHEFAYANHVVGFNAGVEVAVVAAARQRKADELARSPEAAPKPFAQRGRGGGGQGQGQPPPPLPPAAAAAVPRRAPRSVIFHALPERGGAMAARVFSALNWTDGTMDFYAYEDQANGDTAFIRGLAERDGRVRVRGSLSKAALFSVLRGTDYFFYPVTSFRGIVHKDTFANVVAEALALGVIVVAPRVAALPEIYGEHVQFVDPPTAPRDYTVRGAAPNVDGAYSDAAMVAAYADAVRRLEADPERKEWRREAAGAWARRTFTWAGATRRFHDDVFGAKQTQTQAGARAPVVASACFENVRHPPPVRGAFAESDDGRAALELPA